MPSVPVRLPWLAAALALAPTPAAADDAVAGAQAALLVTGAGDLGAGGALSLEATALRFAGGHLRLGGVLGGGALPSSDAQVARTFMPFGPVATLHLGEGGGSSAAVRLAAGGWAGAFEGALRAGGWLAAGLAWAHAVGGGVRLGLGVDVWALFGHGGTEVVYAPGVTLAWTLAGPEPPGGPAP